MEEDGVAEEVANRIVAIGNMTSCISRSKFKAEYDAYADKTSNVLTALFQDPTNINDAFNRVRVFLENGVPNGGWPGLHIDIGETGVKIVQEGFLESLAAVGDMEKNELYDVKDTLENLFCSNNSSDVDRKFRYGLERVDPEFIVDIATSMHDAVASDLNALGTSSPDSSPQIKAAIKEKEIQRSSPVVSDSNTKSVENNEEDQLQAKSPINRIVQYEEDNASRQNDNNSSSEDPKTVTQALSPEDMINMDMNSLNMILGSNDTIWGKPFRPSTKLSNKLVAVTAHEKFISEVERRGIRRKKNQQSGVCIVS